MVINIKDVSFKYDNMPSYALRNISLNMAEGEVVLLCGESGCGKTTLARLINGLIPHYYEGSLTGSVTVNGLNVVKSELYETARHVGSVFQNPRSQFFCVDTTSEIAFGCENMGTDTPTVLSRIREAADDMRIRDLLGRNIFKLSGGEKQKVACASVSAMHPEVIVLDEPTSNLDTAAIESLRHMLRIWKFRKKTIIIAEHRLHWLADICDRAVYMKDGEIVRDLPMNAFIALGPEKLSTYGLRPFSPAQIAYSSPEYSQGDMLELRDYTYAYDNKKTALDIQSLTLPRNHIIAVIGRNGDGKTTFSKCLCGLMRGFKGKIVMDGIPYGRKAMLKKSYMVMQDVNHQLFCESVAEEVRLGMSADNKKDVSAILSQLGLEEYTDRHPVSLSGGQKQRVAVASALLANKEIIVFDEPTSGLDYAHMKATAELIRMLLGKRSVFIVTHDPELILCCCTHVLRLEDGTPGGLYALDTDGRKRLAEFFIYHTKEMKNSFEKTI